MMSSGEEWEQEVEDEAQSAGSEAVANSDEEGVAVSGRSDGEKSDSQQSSNGEGSTHDVHAKARERIRQLKEVIEDEMKQMLEFVADEGDDFERSEARTARLRKQLKFL